MPLAAHRLGHGVDEVEDRVQVVEAGLAVVLQRCDVFGLLRHLLISQRFGGKQREYSMQKPGAAFGQSVVKDARRELTVVVVSFLYDW